MGPLDAFREHLAEALLETPEQRERGRRMYLEASAHLRHDETHD